MPALFLALVDSYWSLPDCILQGVYAGRPARSMSKISSHAGLEDIASGAPRETSESL